MRLKIDNVIFDMDGTLTHLNLPFDEIRRALEIRERFILESILKYKGKKRDEKTEMLKKFEIEAAKTAKLNDGVLELIEFLENEGIRKGVVTRNCLESVRIFSRRFGIDFDYIVSRESTLPKPSPLPTVRAIVEAKSTPERSISVGDFKFDLISGKLAGVKTVLLITERNKPMIPDFINLADHTITNLKQLREILMRS
ncbi:MAG: HAD family hydrolase [Archaeoglobus sp.]|nr:HAD family hydrolase [Archaeoglobus sp.]